MPLEAGGKDGELFMFVFVMCLLVFAWCQWSTVYSMSGFCKFCVPVGIIGAISGVCIYIICIYIMWARVIFIHALFMPGIGPNAGIVSVPTCR